MPPVLECNCGYTIRTPNETATEQEMGDLVNAAVKHGEEIIEMHGLVESVTGSPRIEGVEPDPSEKFHQPTFTYHKTSEGYEDAIVVPEEAQE